MLNDILFVPINKIKKLIGKTNDTGGSDSAGTVMGKLNNVTSKTDSVYSWSNTTLSRVGNANDTGGTNTAGTVMAKLNNIISSIGTRLVDIYNFVSLIGSTTDTGGSSTTGTVMGKLNALAGNSGSVIKRIQSGTVSVSDDATITISTINPSKSFVLLNGGGKSSSQSMPYLGSLSSTSFKIRLSYDNVSVVCSWQVIEFY